MKTGDRMRRAVGWSLLGVVAALISLGFHYSNIRFVPLAAGFAILAGLCFLEWERAEVSNHGIQPGADSGVDRARG